jgi:hypothetical protein
MVRRIAVGRKARVFQHWTQDGRYVRIGRLVLWWYGFRRDSELCAVWWLDPKHRNATNGLTVKPPWCTPLYSEDYGKHRPYLRLFGWRVLSIKHDR